jgi:hypothetical protein
MFWTEIGAKRPNYGQNCTVRWHRLVRSATVTLADRNLDGVITVGTVITVKNPTLRRKCTGLITVHKVNRRP